MANKYRKIEFRFHKELLIILGVILALLVAAILLNLPTKNEKFVAKWQEAGASIETNTLFEEIDEAKLQKTIVATEGNVFVLFVTPSDSESVSLFNEVLTQAETYNVKKIYVLDANDYLGNREEDDELASKLNALQTSLAITEDTQAPALWMFVDGKFARQLDADLVEEQSGYKEAVKQIFVYNLSK